jgi:inner membrane protein
LEEAHLDTITHTLFGLSLYSSINKNDWDKRKKIAYLFTSIGASQIPDSDVISQLWDTEGLYQMWHRGITHSIFVSPIWALIFYLACWFLFRVKDKRLFLLAWLAVAIHNTSDLFNAWGTGFLEPFSQIRITFGTIPIIDFVFWFIIGSTFYLTRRKKEKRPFYFKIAWGLIVLHVFLQSLQGYYYYEKYQNHFEQIALSAGFLPTTFQIITKENEKVTIFEDGIFQKKKELYVLSSKEDANLNQLFAENPKAQTLYNWAPFVVIIEDEKQIGIYDPRFYRNGQSFLFESISH